MAMALLAGIAIMGAAFLLLCACDAAQAEVSQGLALAAVALIAVLPEYSVDMYFTWKAGQLPERGRLSSSGFGRTAECCLPSANGSRRCLSFGPYVDDCFRF
jgi:hypothetical protein